MEAKLVLGILEAEGLIVRIPGALLADGWATWLQTAGLLAVDIQVAKQHVERARELIAQFRAGADAPFLESDFGEGPDEVGS